MSRMEIIFIAVAIVSGVGAFHTYAGYGLLIQLLAAFRRRAVRKGAFKGKVSIVMVARNAAGKIVPRIENLLAQKGSWSSLELVVASDGSTDDTVTEVQGLGHPAVKLIESSEHRGKAAVLNEAVNECAGEIIVFADVRQRYDESTVAELCANFEDEDVGAVSGELLFETDGVAGIGWGLAAYWDIEKIIRRAESRYDSVIGCTGAVYAIRKQLFRQLDPNTVLDDVAVPMQIAVGGKRVVFEPNARAWDRPEEEARRESVRKIRTLAGNIQLCALYPELLSPVRNRLLFQFVSHKILRLFAPWLLCAFLVSTAFFAASSLTASLVTMGQLFFYSLGVIGAALNLPKLGLMKLPAAFLLLNIWAAAAPFRYWSGRLSPKWR